MKLTLTKAVQLVQDFHNACDIPFKNPEIFALENKRVFLRADMLWEEVKETCEADIFEDCLLEKVDGALDTIYILAGTLAEFGISTSDLVMEEHYFNSKDENNIFEEYLNKLLKEEFENESYKKSGILKEKYWMFTNVMFLNKKHYNPRTIYTLVYAGLELFKTCIDYLESIGIDKDYIGDLFEIVHAANMRKVGENGKVIKREDGKILKPQGWYGPEKEMFAFLTNKDLEVS